MVKEAIAGTPRAPQVEAFFHRPTNTVSYVVWDAATRDAAVIDPVLDFDAPSGTVSTASSDVVIAFAASRALTIRWILETHAHADHLSAAQHIKAASGAPVVIGADIGAVQAVFAPRFMAQDVVPDGSAFDRLVRDGEELALGDLAVEVLHTPGHTPACVTYVVGDAAFVGDTLFMPDYGSARADFPGGDARTLYRSIRRILSLPDATRIFVGHDYLPKGRETFAWETSVAAERKLNIHVRDGVQEGDFVRMRQTRDATLGAPALLLPSLQVNIRAGRLPPPDQDGAVRLRLPVSGHI